MKLYVHEFDFCIQRQNSWTCGAIVFRVFLLAIHSHRYKRILLPPLSKSSLKLVCNVNIVNGNLKSENSQDYAQKPQRNCKFMNSASVDYIRHVRHHPHSRIHSIFVFYIKYEFSTLKYCQLHFNSMSSTRRSKFWKHFLATASDLFTLFFVNIQLMKDCTVYCIFKIIKKLFFSDSVITLPVFCLCLCLYYKPEKCFFNESGG